MPHFYSPSKEVYVSTNLKVMYSTLKAQKKLTKLSRVNFFTIKALYQLSGRQQKKNYLLVRNPYHKLESFFKNKLRRSVKTTGEWQHSQKIFFQWIGVKKSDTPQQIAQRLLKLSFEDFIQLLPKIYTKDRHLYPQYWIEYVGNPTLGWRVNYHNVIQIENKNSITQLAKDLELDFEIVVNSTKHLQVDTLWTDELKTIVKTLYLEDFKRYGYKF